MVGLMKEVLEQDNDTWQTLAAATARLLQRYEQQQVDGGREPNSGRGDEKDCGSDGSKVTKRRNERMRGMLTLNGHELTRWCGPVPIRRRAF